jgi:hypothetical protein
MPTFPLSHVYRESFVLGQLDKRYVPCCIRLASWLIASVLLGVLSHRLYMSNPTRMSATTATATPM